MRSFQRVAYSVGFTLLILSISGTLAGAEDEDAVAGVGSTLDYPALQDCLDGPNAPVAAECADSNFFPDAHIDLLDFAVLQRSYQTIAPGPIQLGVETSGEIAPASDADEFSFNAAFGAFVTVDFSTPLVNNRPDVIARIELVRPNGTVASTNVTCGAAFRIDSVSIDATGLWRARVRVYESWQNCGFGADEAVRTGIYTLTVCLSTSPSIPIAYGETRYGSFASDCQIVNYAFEGAVGDMITALYVGPAYARNVRLYAPNGTLLTASGAGSGTGFLDYNLPATGTYRLAVESGDGQTTTGGFALGLTALHEAESIPNSVTRDDVLSKPAEAHIFSFQGLFGSKVNVDFSTPLVNTRPDIVARLDLVRPDGTLASSNATCGANFRLDAISINMNGTWTARVRPYEGWFNCGFGASRDLTVGDYRLTVCTADAPPLPIAYAQTRAGSFTSDCQIVNFAFTGSANDLVTALYDGPAYTRYMQLFTPTGVLLATSSAGQGTGFIDARLPVNGVYRLAVEAADAQAIGAFTLALSELSNCAPILSGTTVNAALTNTLEADTFCFNASAGTLATVDIVSPLVNNRPDVIARLDLVRPNGTLFSSTATCTASFRLDLLALDMSGTWTARVRPYESWFQCGQGSNNEVIRGDYALTVCTSDAPAAPLAYGQSTSGNFVTDCDIRNFQFDGLADDVVTVLYFGPAYTRGIRLYAPNGTLITTAGGGTGTGFTEVHLPVDGTYRLAVEANDGQALGDFVLSLSELSDADPITFNTVTGGTITPAGEMDNWTFNAPFGATATVEFETPLVSNRPDVLARVDLIRPDGVLATTTATCGTAFRLDNILLNREGLWTARVRTYESWLACGQGTNPIVAAGNYNLTVCPSNGTPAAISYGQTRPGYFDVDCEMENYQFTGALGDVVSALFLGPAYARRMSVYAPNGTLLTTSGGGTCPGIYDLTLPIDGNYRLLAEANDGQPIDDYTLGINKRAAPTAITLNTPRAASLSAVGETDVYSFAGTSGTPITIDFVTPSAGGRPDVLVRLDLVRPDGTAFTNTPSCGLTARINAAILDATGTWTARVRAYESWCACGFGADANLLTGNYTLTVCNAASCPP